MMSTRAAMPEHHGVLDAYSRGKLEAIRLSNANAWQSLQPALRHLRSGRVEDAERSMIRAFNRMVRQVRSAEADLDVPIDHRLA